MTTLSILIGCVILLAAGVSWKVVAATGGIALFSIGALTMWSVLWDHAREKRRNHDAFVREVVRAHQRANEARQATERA